MRIRTARRPRRFGNPYAVIHRADMHQSLLEGAKATGRVDVSTSTTVQRSNRMTTA